MGGVADDERLRGRDRLAVDESGASECDLGQLASVAGVRSVAAEGEVTVQARAVQLDVGGGLDVPGVSCFAPGRKVRRVG
jgi:hypothetical protein